MSSPHHPSGPQSHGQDPERDPAASYGWTPPRDQPTTPLPSYDEAGRHQQPAGPSPAWERPAGPRDQGAAQKGFFASLFDFSFSSYVTLRFAKVLFVVLLVACVLLWLTYLVAAASTGEGVVLLLALLLGWIPSAVVLLFYRMVLEFFVATVRGAENTREMLELMRSGRGRL